MLFSFCTHPLGLVWKGTSIQPRWIPKRLEINLQHVEDLLDLKFDLLNLSLVAAQQLWDATLLMYVCSVCPWLLQAKPWRFILIHYLVSWSANNWQILGCISPGKECTHFLQCHHSRDCTSELNIKQHFLMLKKMNSCLLMERREEIYTRDHIKSRSMANTSVPSSYQAEA